MTPEQKEAIDAYKQSIPMPEIDDEDFIEWKKRREETG